MVLVLDSALYISVEPGTLYYSISSLNKVKTYIKDCGLQQSADLAVVSSVRHVPGSPALAETTRSKTLTR